MDGVLRGIQGIILRRVLAVSILVLMDGVLRGIGKIRYHQFCEVSILVLMDGVLRVRLYTVRPF